MTRSSHSQHIQLERPSRLDNEADRFERVKVVRKRLRTQTIELKHEVARLRAVELLAKNFKAESCKALMEKSKTQDQHQSFFISLRSVATQRVTRGTLLPGMSRW